MFLSTVRHLSEVLRRNPSLGADLPTTEHVLAIGPDGVIVRRIEGSRSEVALGGALNETLETPGSNIILVHNHPHSGGLSGDDLEQLAKPGVVGVIAVGHDGSLYAATAAAAYDARRFDTRLYPYANREIRRQLRIEAPTAHVVPELFDNQAAHLIAIALAKGNLIQYWSTLSDSRRRVYARFIVLFGHITGSVGTRLQRDSLRQVAHAIRPHDEHIAVALEQATQRSTTFFGLVNRLERSDLVVDIESGHCRTAAVLSCIAMTPSASTYRHVRVTIETNHSVALIISELAHELQHAVEIAAAPDVVDQVTLHDLYRRIGQRGVGRNAIETAQAITAAHQVSLEVNLGHGVYGGPPGRHVQ
jgi:hypothetical protein